MSAQGREGESSSPPCSSDRRPRGSASRPCSTPSPATSPPRPTKRRSTHPPRPATRSRSPADEDGPLLVRVFKTTADPFVGRLTYLRVLSGTLQSQAHVWNTTRDEDERIGQLLLLHGKEQEPIGELKAGEIGAVAKLTVTETGDTLSVKEKPAQPAAARVPGAVARGRYRAPSRSRTSTRWDRRLPGCSRRTRRSGSSGPATGEQIARGRWARPTPR